jgi:ubiquinone/menaquinone biosynthesis C-methylase UbiE
MSSSACDRFGCDEFDEMSFDVAADDYDRYMGKYSLQLSPQLADFAGVRSGQRVLDVGCGPGPSRRSWSRAWGLLP